MTAVLTRISNQTSNYRQAVCSVSYGSSLDFRRRADREFVERILQRSEHLRDHDRQLLNLIFAGGKTAVDAASLLDKPPRAVRRQLRKLVLRLNSPRYLFVALHHKGWPPTRRGVAVACFLNGRSMSRAASELRLSYHTVRRHHDAIAALAEAAGA